MMHQFINSKLSSILICMLVYIIAIMAAWFSADFLEQHFNLLITTLCSDILATIVVFVFSVLFRNSSLYDPYWSVAPPIIIWFWMYKMQNDLSIVSNLIFAVTILWSLRLTINWLRGWQGLTHEDWRYVQLRKQNPKLYPVTNFAGIHIFPTLIVFACILPCYYAVQINNADMNPAILIGLIICLFATIISLVADEQMRVFRKIVNRNAYMITGLWSYSRHPNYLGEILFWWGIWIIAIGINIQLYWTVFGSIALTLMFVFISIPMMEKRSLQKREKYSEVIKSVPMLIKLF